MPRPEPVARQAEQAGVVRQICQALYPDFTWPDNNRDTTKTFRLMISAMLVFGTVLVIWAAGAGAMRAVWLLRANPVQLPGFGWTGNSCATAGCDALAGLFTLAEMLRAAGGAVLICLAGGLAGGFFGFLFGIPHTDNDQPAKPAAKSNYALSTNLTAVSDWLTKVIVGVSLVEAQKAYDGFVSVSTQAAAWLFESRGGSPAVLAAALAGGGIFGFMFSYVYAQLILSRLIGAADRALAAGADATRSMQNIDGTARRLVPPIRRTTDPQPTQARGKLTEDEYKAAFAYYGVSFNELTSNPSVTDVQILSWARARALLNDYRSAVLAYFYLLGGQGLDQSGAPADPDLLMEASRVMNAAGPDYAGATKMVSGLAEDALNNAKSAAPPTRAAILSDAAALRLREGDYKVAIEKINAIGFMTNPDPYDRGRLYLLRALANGQWYTALRTTHDPAEPELTALRQSIRQDLDSAFELDPDAKTPNESYWKPDDGKSPPPAKAKIYVPETDLRQFYDDDPAFRAALAEPPGKDK